MEDYNYVFGLAFNDALLRVHPLVNRVAREVVGDLELARERQKFGETLLRAAEPSDIDTLVRPASNADSNRDSLLQPVKSHEDNNGP